MAGHWDTVNGKADYMYSVMRRKSVDKKRKIRHGSGFIRFGGLAV